MKVVPILPIETFYGKLNERGKYYFRRSRKGIVYACLCPDRTGHIKTPTESANQKRFAARYAGKH